MGSSAFPLRPPLSDRTLSACRADAGKQTDTGQGNGQCPSKSQTTLSPCAADSGLHGVAVTYDRPTVPEISGDSEC